MSTPQPHLRDAGASQSLQTPLLEAPLVCVAPIDTGAGTPWRVLKFGGTSVSTPARLQVLLAQVREAAASRRVVVVVSALAGVTDALGALVARVVAGDDHYAATVDALRDRHLELLAAAVPGDSAPDAEVVLRSQCRRLAGLLAEVAAAHAADERQRAALLATGERLCVPLVAALLRESGITVDTVDPTRLLRARGFALEAEPDIAASARAVREWAARTRARVTVVGGFLAADAESGDVVLLGRGGSDTSASLLGEALAADRVEIWTDVDGVFSADPRLLADARCLPRLAYAQAQSLARHGARVLHAGSIAPVARAAIPLHVRNTLRPDAPGTVIGPGAPVPAHTLAAPAANDGVATVAVVGPGAGICPHLAQRVRQVLAAHAIVPQALARGVDDHALVAQIPSAQRESAVRALHAAWAREPARVDLVLVGARGQVGSALRRLLAREAPAIATRQRLDLRLRAAFDRRGFAQAADGLDPMALEGQFAARTVDDWPALAAQLPTATVPAIVVDCTASEQIAEHYAALLGAGIGVVSANKHAGAGDARRWQQLAALDVLGVPWRRETTVAAALPVLAALRELAARGERVLAIEGVLSGSLSHILSRVELGVGFCAAVREAQSLGYTEPDPAEDLAARDVARKLVILAREAGATLDLAAVEVEPLLAPGAWSATPDESAIDAHWRARAESARSAAARLVMVARWDGRRATVRVSEEPLESPLAQLCAGENLVRIRSEFHDTLPLLIRGPGAGPAVTGAGVLSDVIAAAQRLAARASA